MEPSAADQELIVAPGTRLHFVGTSEITLMSGSISVYGYMQPLKTPLAVMSDMRNQMILELVNKKILQQI